MTISCWYAPSPFSMLDGGGFRSITTFFVVTPTSGSCTE